MNRKKLRSTLLAATLCLFWLSMESQAFGQIHHIAEMTTDQISSLDRSKTAVILPGGILEQHGPYLPSFSDGYMNERLTQDLAEAIVERPGWNALIFPIIPLGNGGANEIGRKYSFSGTYTVRFSTLRAVFMDLATELGEQGFRWIFVVHLHGAPNHNRALDQAGDYFHDTFGGEMVNLWGTGFQGGQDLRTEKERLEDGFSVHAGMDETSRIMFLRPDLVPNTVRQAQPQTGRNWEELERIAKSDEWRGYFGSPRLVSAAYGARVWKALSTRLVDLAMRILDGYDHREPQRYADFMESSPTNVEIDSDALEREREVERRQRDWLIAAGLEDER